MIPTWIMASRRHLTHRSTSQAVTITWTAYPQVRGVADKTMPVVTKILADGGIEIEDAASYAYAVHLASADTMELSGNYYYEIIIDAPLIEVEGNRRTTPTIGTMTVINSDDPINVVAFKSMFPDLEAIDDGVLQTALDEAALFVDDTIWSPSDVPAATFYLAAHFAFTAQSAAGSGGQAVSSERIGQIAVTYAVTSTAGVTSAYPSLSNSNYGLMYLALMRRNSPGIVIV